MSGICDGRVVIVTGAGRGIGRGEALEFARQGARVVVNDLGGEVDGSGRSTGPAQQVVEEICAAGGEAVANGDDISSWDGAERLIRCALDTWGRVDVLVNNAGILRDKMLVNMTEQEWDAVMQVHLKGTFAPSRFAAVWWREQAKAGKPVDARIINTTSASGLFGNPGQTNYAAAKAGIAAFTIVAAKELERYGVTVNAIGPGARTRMTEPLGYGANRPDEGFDAFAPDNVAPLVVWLGSRDSAGVSGRVFEVSGGRIGVAEGWRRGPRASRSERWDPALLGPVVRELLGKAAEPEPIFRRD